MGQKPDELSSGERIVVRYASTREDARELSAAAREPDQPEELAAAREDIEQTRAEMSSTIDAIQDKLDPEVLSEQAKDTAHDVTDYAIEEAKQAAREITDHAVLQAREAVRDITGQAKLAVREATIGRIEEMTRTATDTAGGLRQSLVETIKANPMPAALVGLGIGWMFLNRPSSSGASYAGSVYGRGGYSTRPLYSTGYPSHQTDSAGLSNPTDGAQHMLGQAIDRAQDTAGQVTDQVQTGASQVVDQVQSGATQVVDQVQATGAQVVGQVQEQAAQAQSFLQRQLQDNPLLVGAVAAAIGGVLAGAVSTTPREDQLMGETRDRLMGTAKELTQDTMHKVGRVVDEAQNAAKETAREESLVPESGASTSSL